MAEIGKFNILKMARKTPVGIFLTDESGIDILLPLKHTTGNPEPGEDVRVFLYKDNEGRWLATMQQPKILLDEFALLEAVTVNDFGAFMDWGLDKHLYVPIREMDYLMHEGESYIIHMHRDKKGDRLIGSSKIQQFISNEELSLQERDEVDLLVWDSSGLGWKVIVNNRYEGLIFYNEIFTEIAAGDRLKGFVKKIRDDRKIDISLQQQGFSNVEPNALKILELLKASKGFLPFNDKTDPETITASLAMSKKTFKKAIGTLYRQELIVIEENGIYLNKEHS